jgi:hypothetical protein
MGTPRNIVLKNGPHDGARINYDSNHDSLYIHDRSPLVSSEPLILPHGNYNDAAFVGAYIRSHKYKANGETQSVKERPCEVFEFVSTNEQVIPIED